MLMDLDYVVMLLIGSCKLAHFMQKMNFQIKLNMLTTVLSKVPPPPLPRPRPLPLHVGTQGSRGPPEPVRRTDPYR